MACHVTLVTANPKGGSPCAFLDARTEVEVNAQDGRLEVDLERGTEIDRLRKQVRTALRPAP